MNRSMQGRIELRQVTKCFGAVTAVDGISLDIRGGEFFSLLGPSGCGKTTTLRLIAGFERPTTGEILLEGVSVTGIPPHRRNVNTVFQSYALFPHLTVEENIGFGLKMKRLPKSEINLQVEDVLSLVKLTGLGERKPSELSGGQQQRVALARALVNHPAILLLDEPLAALDLKLRKQMQIELKVLQRQVGITFVYVTHDQGEALSLSDRIAVMQDGRVLQIGTPSDLYEHPNCHFVADFIGQSNFFPATVAGHREGGLTLRLTGAESLIEVPAECGYHPGQEVILAVRPERLQISTNPPPPPFNGLYGMVSEVMYLGTLLQYTVSVSDSLQVLVHQPNLGSDSTPPIPRASKVYITWLPEHGILLESMTS